MISQSINSKSKLADYKEYYKQAKVEIEELKAIVKNQDFLIEAKANEQVKANAETKPLKLIDYRNDISRRVGEHNKEVDFLVRDLTVLFTTAKRQVVQLFPVPVN